MFRRSIYEQTSGWNENFGRNSGQIIDILLQIALISNVHFVSEKLYQYRLHNSNQLHINVNFEEEAKKIINKWKNQNHLNSEQKKQVDHAIFFYEKRLVPLVAMMSANQLITERKILPALSLYFQGAKNYFLSLFFLSTFN